MDVKKLDKMSGLLAETIMLLDESHLRPNDPLVSAVKNLAEVVEQLVVELYESQGK